jgi:hypothetical protein
MDQEVSQQTARIMEHSISFQIPSRSAIKEMSSMKLATHSPTTALTATI